MNHLILHPNRRVLVIDDNKSIHQDFKKILEDSETSNAELDELDADLFGEEPVSADNAVTFELVHAYQGVDGVEILRQEIAEGRTFGCAFVDMRMPPGWDGLKTIEEIWKIDPNLQVVICTAFSDHNLADISKDFGFTDRLLILKKPFDEVEILQLAISLSEKRRLLEAANLRLDKLQTVVGEQAAELVAVHENAEALIRSIKSALVCLDENRIIKRWNTVATELFGLSAADVEGKDLLELPIDWVERDTAKTLFTQHQSDGQSHEISFTDNIGQTRTLDVRICSIVDDSTSTSRLILANDITNQKSLQNQLDQAQRLEAVGQLAAGVAHEINTPMQYIGDNVRYVNKTLSKMQDLFDMVQAALDESVTDETLLETRKNLQEDFKLRKVKSNLRQIPEALTDSIAGVENVSRIVAAMKEFSHPGGSDKSRVDLKHILESTITVARNEWKYVADIETEFDEELPAILAFPSELNQAFLNVVVNASHAISDRVESGDYFKGKITISTRRDRDNALVIIKDTGGGVPNELREKIFEPFFTTKKVGKGTGQGLAIAHNVIVNKHEGRLYLDVEEGVGSTFTFELPIQELFSETNDHQELATAKERI